MKSFTLPDGRVITYSGELADKIQILERMGIPYTPTAEELQAEADITQLKDAYLTMIARLEQIENAGTIPFTQAGFNQVVQAVKDEALYIERAMKFLKNLLT